MISIIANIIINISLILTENILKFFLTLNIFKISIIKLI